jgi:sugar-specific transcriptional regulator TrmB
MYKKHLQDIGLSGDQADVYNYLVTHSGTSASTIARNTKIQRTFVYLILNELIGLSLVERNDSAKVARFSITNPEYINNFVEQKKSEISLAEKALETIKHPLARQYSIQSGQPGVSFFVGLDGLKKLYHDINDSGEKNLWIIRSNTRPHPEILTEINKQVDYQIRKGIKVRLINSSTDSNLKEGLESKKDINLERGIVAGEVFKNPAQIIIYQDKVAFTTFTEPEFTTIIENADIATTLRSTYQLVWRQSQIETKMHLASIRKK